MPDTQMNILIIYNPHAGRHRGWRHAIKLEKALIKRANQKGVINLFVTLFASQSINAMREYLKEGKNNGRWYNSIVIIGGDGTVGPVVDALIKNQVAAPIYCYGRGTANDFSTFFKTNRSPALAARLILDGDKNCARVDTLQIYEGMPGGEPDPIYACNVACGGAFTNGVTPYDKKRKRALGKLSYFIQAFVQSFKLESQIMRFTVDGQTFDLDVFLFFVLNTKNVGGLINSSPLSNVCDGKLDLMCVKKCGVFGRAWLAIHYAFGAMHRCKFVRHIQGTDFRIEHLPTTGKENGEKLKHNFTLTDIDGNPGAPYPIAVRTGPQIKIIHNKSKIK